MVCALGGSNIAETISLLVGSQVETFSSQMIRCATWASSSAHQNTWRQHVVNGYQAQGGTLSYGSIAIAARIVQNLAARVSLEKLLELRWPFSHCCPMYKAEHGNVPSRGQRSKVKFVESCDLINANVFQKSRLHNVKPTQNRTRGMVYSWRSVL